MGDVVFLLGRRFLAGIGKISLFYLLMMTLCLGAQLAAFSWAVWPEAQAAGLSQHPAHAADRLTGVRQSQLEELQPPEVTADAVILADKYSGKVLYEKNADKQMNPASTTKIMTSIVALELGQLSEPISISRHAANTEYSGMQVGETATTMEMLQLMMQVSENGIATAVAEHIDGDEWSFAQRMNSLAHKLNMEGTNFVNPHGLTQQNHYTTARDLYKLASYAMDNKYFRRLVSRPYIYTHYIYPAGQVEKWRNSNKLLLTYPGCIGIKTGYTEAAGYCLVSAAQRDGHELYCVLLHSDSSESRFAESAALLDYGFQLLSQRNPKRD